MRSIGCIGAVLTVLLLAQSACFGAEAGVGPYWPGFRNFLAGVIPSKPGFYFRDDLVYYTATAQRVVLNGLPVENANVHLWADIVEPYYVFPKKLFGATHAFVVTQPFVWAKVSGQIIGTELKPAGSNFGPGDTIVSPIFLGWNKGKLHWNSNLAVFIPNGAFDPRQVVNTSRNYWTLDPEFGFTYLDPCTGWDLSGVLGYAVSFENGATRYRTGNVAHLDYAFGKTLKSGVKPGVVGYAWVQVTPDGGQGAIFGAFESRVFGIGPAVQWSMGKTSTMMLRYIHEFGASNHFSGDQSAWTFRVAF